MKFDPDEWLQVWTFSAERALAFFGLAADTPVVVLEEGPKTEWACERYHAEAKLFGIRGTPAVPGAHSTPDARKGAR
jgi:hypothetical protein